MVGLSKSQLSIWSIFIHGINLNTPSDPSTSEVVKEKLRKRLLQSLFLSQFFFLFLHTHNTWKSFF